MECKSFHPLRHFRVQATALEADVSVRWPVVVRKQCHPLPPFQVRATVLEAAGVWVRCPVSAHKVSRLLSRVRAEATEVDAATSRAAVRKVDLLRG